MSDYGGGLIVGVVLGSSVAVIAGPVGALVVFVLVSVAVWLLPS
jgi:amino acid permease